MRSGKYTGLALITPALLLIFLVSIYPVARNIYFSFFDYNLITRNPVFVGLNNYRILLDTEYWDTWLRTLIWTLGGLSLQLAVGIPLGLIMSRRFRFRRYVRSLLIIPWVMPPVVTCLLWRLLYEPRWGMIDYLLSIVGVPRIQFLGDPDVAMISIIGVNVWYGYAFVMIVIMAGLQSIPGDLYEAANIDGATFLQQLYHITMPELKYFIGTVAVLRFIWIFQFFDIPWLMTSGGPGDVTVTLPILTYRTAFASLQIGKASAIAATMAAFLFLVSIVAVRTLKES